MHDSKLIQLLSSLTPNDLVTFPKYVQQFPTALNKTAFTLFSYCRRFAPEYTSTRLRRDLVRKHLIKNKIITDARLNKIAHQLKKLVEDFLVDKDLTDQPLLKRYLFLQSLKRRNAKNFANESKKLIGEIRQKKGNNLRQNLHLHLLYDELWSDANTEKISGSIEHFQLANDHLDSFYLRQKLAYILEYNSSKAIRSTDFQLLFVPSILQFIQQHPSFKEDLAIGLRLLAIQMQQSNKKEDFLKLKAQLFTHFDRLSKKDGQDILVLLINFYHQHLETEKAFYINEGFLLYQFAINKKLLIENGRMRTVEYSNIATLGFYANQNEWTLQFLDNFKPFLDNATKDVIYAQLYAYFHFLQGQFELAHQWILRAENSPYADLPITIKVRMLKLRILYEIWQDSNFENTKFCQLLENQAKSLIGFLKEHPQLPTKKSIVYLNFLTFFKRMIHLEGKLNLTIRVEKFKLALSQTSNLKYKDWLFEKITQLENTYPTKRK